MNYPTYEKSLFHKEFENRYPAVSKYAAHEYKYTLDDSLRDILSQDYGLKVSYTLTDLKLFLGFLASMTGIGGAVYGYFYKNRPYHVSFFVVAYFFFVGLLTYVSYFIEKDRVVLGSKKKLTVQFSTRFEPLQKNQYKIHAVAHQGPRRTKLDLALPISKLFTESGQLVSEEWYRLIMSWMQRIEKELGNQ